ncbi:9985_t:CDS:1, partial [Entrophospora sp. SA101]
MSLEIRLKQWLMDLELKMYLTFTLDFAKLTLTPEPDIKETIFRDL